MLVCCFIFPTLRILCRFGFGVDINVMCDSIFCIRNISEAKMPNVWQLCLCSLSFFHAYFSLSPERKKGAKRCDAPTGPMTLLLYYSFDGCVEGVEILNRT